MSTGLSLEESAARAGAHRWSEGRLFEVLGSWVSSTFEPPIKLMFDRHSQHHAWRAAQWWERMPVLADVDRGALTAPGSPAEAAAADHLVGLGTTIERLAGAYRSALPRRIVAYRRHLERVGTVGDGSSARTLDLMLADCVADWQEGETALQDLLGEAAAAGDHEAVRRAATTVADVESVMVNPLG